MIKKISIFSIVIIILILVSSLSYADYYADVVINVEKDGNVIISGISNHPVLEERITPELTSKNGKYWLLNISTENVFSEYIYELNLPPSTEINYIKTPIISGFRDTSQGLQIKGIGENKTFNIILQYSFVEETKFSINPLFYLLPLIVLLAFIIVYIFTRKKKIKKKISYDEKSLTERELIIVKILEKHKRRMSQADLEKEMSIPKSSLSRNLASLERKEIIQKTPKGMTNYITFRNVPPNSGKN